MPKLWRHLSTAADAAAAVMFFAAFAMFIVGIFFRYVLRQPIAWSEESIIMVFVWMLFWTLATVTPVKRQISFGIVYESAPPQLRRAMAILAIVLAGTLFVLAIPATFEFLQWVARERTAALRISRGYTYASFALFMVSVPLRLFGWGARLVGRRWEEHL